jgi:hypothetical protein
MSVSPGRTVSLPELLREVRETSTAILRPHLEALRRVREPLWRSWDKRTVGCGKRSVGPGRRVRSRTQAKIAVKGLQSRIR